MFFGAWFIMVHAQSYWNLTGNSNVTNSNFIGNTITNECISLNFKTRNIQRMRLGATASFLQIGTTISTNTSLHVHYQNDNFLCEDSNIVEDEIDFLGGKRLLQLTTPETGDRTNNGFLVTASPQKELLFKQQENANFYIEGVGGGLTIAQNGNVGIGINIPLAKLDVNGSFKASSANISGAFSAQNASISSTLTANTISASNANISGSLTANLLSVPNAKIAGLLCAQEVRVSYSGSPCWPDFVFEKDYKLMPLNEVEQYIAINQHLPNIPSVTDVETNGIDLGEMNAKLLQKIEELTLYVIELQKQVNELKATREN